MKLVRFYSLGILVVFGAGLPACGGGGGGSTAAPPPVVVDPPPPPQPLSMSIGLDLSAASNTAPVTYQYDFLVTKTSNTDISDVTFFLRDAPPFLNMSADGINFASLPEDQQQIAAGAVSLQAIVAGLIPDDFDGEILTLDWEYTFFDGQTQSYQEAYLTTQLDVSYK